MKKLELYIMISKETVNQIILKVTKDIIENKLELSLTTSFIGADSNIESIDIVQIITEIEEKLEDAGLENFDLFDKVFEKENLTFDDLSELIINELS